MLKHVYHLQHGPEIGPKQVVGKNKNIVNTR
jgi:hypothetical protein